MATFKNSMGCKITIDGINTIEELKEIDGNMKFLIGSSEWYLDN